MKKIDGRLLLLCVLCVLPVPVFAHAGVGNHGLGAGLWHPLGGLDHLLSAVTVGLWASQTRGQGPRLWLLPGAFAAALSAGALLPSLGIGLPFTEQFIAASLLVLGLGVASAGKVSTAVSVALVAAFALFHGYAHGMDMPVTGSLVPYIIGLTLSTALLQAAGVAAGRTLQRLNAAPVIRLAGGVIAFAGVYLAGG